MALVTFKQPIDSLRGRIAELVYNMNGSQGVARAFKQPKTSNTTPQSAIRNTLAAISAAYSQLTAAEVAAWAAVAVQVNTRQRITGTEYAWNARTLYQSVNTHIVRAGGSVSDTPPTDLTCPNYPTIGAVTYVNATKYLTIPTTGIVVTSGYYRVRLTPPTATTAAAAEEGALRIPTATAQLSYIEATDASGDGHIQLTLPTALAALFHGSTTLQFGLELQALSAALVPNAAPYFIDRVAYTKS